MIRQIENSIRKVVVLILTYNGRHLLEESIPSYLANDYPNFDVIVIDNGSCDETKEWVGETFPTVQVLRTEKNLGYSGGFNLGLEYAFSRLNADYALITNNDVKADQKVISELVQAAEKDEANGFVTGKVYYYDNPDMFQTVGYYEDAVRWIGGHIGNKERDFGQYDHDCERFMSDDIFMLVKRSAYEKTGGYNTLFRFQGEQADWQARAKKAGFKIFYAHKAKIWHKDSMTIGKSSSFKAYYDVRNTILLRLLHKDEKFNEKYFKWYLKHLVVIPFVKKTIKLNLSLSFAIIRGFLSAMKYAVLHKLFTLRYLF